MKIHITDTLPQFVELRDAWIVLRLRGLHSLPFDSHRWLSAWWESLQAEPGKGIAAAITAWAGDELVAAMPIHFSKARHKGLSVAQCSLLGGNWGAVSVLSYPELRAQSIPAMLHELEAAGMPHWRLFRALPVVRDDGADLLFAELKRNYRRSRCSIRTHPYIPLAVDWETYLATRSKNFRRTLKRSYRALREAGLTLQIRSDPSAAEIRDIIGSVSQKSWQGLSGQAIAATAFGRRFYDRIAESDGEFNVHLASLHGGERPIAYLLGLVSEGIYHAFDTGFDPAWSAQSPGLVLQLAVLEEVHRMGLTEFNFGYDAQYKERFEPQHREVLDIVSIRSPGLAILDRAADWLAPAWRLLT